MQLLVGPPELRYIQNVAIMMFCEHPEDVYKRQISEVKQILEDIPKFIDRPEQHEYFQRKYGLDPKHKKDNRNLALTKTVTAAMIARQKIMQAYITESLQRPITRITPMIVDYIVQVTGIDGKTVENVLVETYPNGSVGAFMTKYFEMAFKGRDEATEFEKATVELFQDVFGYEAKHVGPIGLTPDVLLLSDSDGYQAILEMCIRDSLDTVDFSDGILV